MNDVAVLFTVLYRRNEQASLTSLVSLLGGLELVLRT
jgi:hypothetical protein